MAADSGNLGRALSPTEAHLIQQTAEMRDCLADLQTWVEGQRIATQVLIGTIKAGRARNAAQMSETQPPKSVRSRVRTTADLARATVRANPAARGLVAGGAARRK